MSVTAAEFLGRLDELPKPTPMGRIFALAKDCIDMEPPEIERLLENPVHAARVGAEARARNGDASCSSCTYDGMT